MWESESSNFLKGPLTSRKRIGLIFLSQVQLDGRKAANMEMLVEPRVGVLSSH